MQLPLSGDAGSLVFKIGKGAVALGNEEQRLQSFGFSANVMDETHQICLWREISDPDGVACNTPLVPSLQQAADAATEASTYHFAEVSSEAHGQRCGDRQLNLQFVLAKLRFLQPPRLAC